MSIPLNLRNRAAIARLVDLLEQRLAIAEAAKETIVLHVEFDFGIQRGICRSLVPMIPQHVDLVLDTEELQAAQSVSESSRKP